MDGFWVLPEDHCNWVELFGCYLRTVAIGRGKRLVPQHEVGPRHCFVSCGLRTITRPVLLVRIGFWTCARR